MIDRIRKKPIEVQRITLKNLLGITSGECFIFNGEIWWTWSERRGYKKNFGHVYIYSYKTGWSTCANLLKHFKDYIWFHQILLKQNKLHLKIKLKLFLIFFQKREASQEKILKDPNYQL